MKNLSWNLRIMLGLVGVAILVAIGFFAWYTFVRLDRDGPLDYDTYPNAELMNEDELPGQVLRRYAVPDAPENVQRYYTEREFECTATFGDVQEGDTLREDVFVRATCLRDRSHPLGFEQTLRLSIQPERAPLIYQDNNPQNSVIGGGEPTGRTIIDVRATWTNMGLLGG